MLEDGAQGESVPAGRWKRIAVVGTTGSGKTTLAAELAWRLGVRHVELDALNWEPHWTQAPDDVFRSRVATALAGDGWVMDGNYSRVQGSYLGRAQAVVWLDYPLRIILWRLWWRTLRRIRRKELLWGVNQERFRTQFLSRESLFLWVLQTYHRRRRQYTRLFSEPAYADVTVVRLRSPGETERWLANTRDVHRS